MMKKPHIVLNIVLNEDFYLSYTVLIDGALFDSKEGATISDIKNYGVAIGDLITHRGRIQTQQHIIQEGGGKK